MRTLTLVVVLLLAAVQPALACSCTAPDGSCSASATGCSGGCYAVCGAGGCSSGCSGGGGPRTQADGPTFSYTGRGLSAADLEDLIGQELKVRVFFVPKKTDDQFSVELNEVSAADLRTALGKVGAAAIVEQSGEGAPEKAGTGLRFSLKAENIEAGTVGSLFRSMFGDEVTVKVANPGSLVSLDFEDVSLDDLRNVLPQYSGIRVLTPERADRSH